MDLYKELGVLINQLKNIFTSNNGKILYDKKAQDKVNHLLEKIANLSKTFENNIKNERRNIKDELTIIDTETGEKVELVDVNSISNRVRNILSKNNIFSCLKSLALTNKCAHIFDGDIKRIKSNIEKYYNLIYYPSFDKSTFSFMDSIEQVFPQTNFFIYNLDGIEEYQFNKICNALFSDNKLNKDAKINILKSLNITFDIKNESQINDIFEKIKNQKENLVYSYLIQQYKTGKYIVSLQSKMFAIKDEYISMIGQLLKKDERFANIKYELIRTPDATPGFEYMLIIDDRDLQYYIEVHMPNFVATSLMKQYGLFESKERAAQKLGASAVYERSKDEINKVLNALNTGLLDTKGEKRAQIITRGYTTAGGGIVADDLQTEFSSGKVDSEKVESRLEDYSFLTDKIEEPLSLLEKYLVSNEIHLNEIEFNREIQRNENYPLNLTKIIAHKNYYNIYINFNDDNKKEFIKYSLNELKNGDAFDKTILQTIYNNIYNYDYDLIGKLLINKNILKEEFVYNIKYTIDEMLNINKEDININSYINKNLIYNQKEKINNLMNEYISKYLYDEYDKENNKNGPTK